MLLNARTILRASLSALIAVLSVSAVYAGVGRETFQFMKIKPSAKSLSFGCGAVSVVDVSSAYQNPATLSLLRHTSLGLSHVSLPAGLSFEHVSTILPLDEGITASVFGSYLSFGSIEGTAEDALGGFGGFTGAFNPYDAAAGISIGFSVDGPFSAGASLKYAMEKGAGEAYSAVFADFGALYSDEGLSAGLVLKNIGGADNSAPAAAEAGVSKILDDGLTLVAGCNYTLSSAVLYWSAGGEYCYEGIFSVRGCYTGGSDSDGLNVGAGAKLNIGGQSAVLDYNYSFMGELGGSHRITAGVLFDGGGDSPKKERFTKNPNRVIKYYFKKK